MTLTKVNEAQTKVHPSMDIHEILKGGKDLDIGVKSTSAFEEDYAPMIPDLDPEFHEDPSVVPIVEFCLKGRKNLMVIGPPGIGKSSLILNIAARNRISIEYYGCSGESNTDQLIGIPSATLIDGVKMPCAVFGAAVLAFKYGGILLLDEMDFLSPEVAASLHQIAELSTKRITIHLNGKHIIQRHPKFFIVGTANTAGHGEDGFIYHGTQAQNAAFMNRFTYTAAMTYLPRDVEIDLVKKKTGVNGDTAIAMVFTAQDSREQVAREEGLVTAISPRDLFAWGDAIQHGLFGWEEGAKIAFLNRMSKSDQTALEILVANRKPT